MRPRFPAPRGGLARLGAAVALSIAAIAAGCSSQSWRQSPGQGRGDVRDGPAVGARRRQEGRPAQGRYLLLREHQREQAARGGP